MSTREKAVCLLNDMTEYQVELVFAYMSGIVQSEHFNNDTEEAFREIDEMKKHPETVKGYDSFADLMKEVLDA